MGKSEPTRARVITVTDGNVRNHHVYLRDIIDFFPSEAIGGTSRADASPNKIRVDWADGVPPVETDIDSDKLFFRDRSFIRAFFDRYQVQGGDRVVIEKLGDDLFRMRPVTMRLSLDHDRRG